MAFRVDLGSLRSPKRLADGRLRVDGHLTRAGVFEYREHDGSVRREYRPPSEVFRADSLETFADVIFTDDHPPEMVNAQNAREYGVGYVTAPRRDGEQMAASIMVNDAATIAKIEAGKHELSCGYEVDLDETPGVTPDGERYDAVQRNIRGNHVALVMVGRAGPDAKLRLDCAMMVAQAPTRQDKAHTMTLEALAADLAAAKISLGAEKARADLAEANLATAQAATAAAAARADGAEAALATEKAARTDAAAALPALVKSRVALELAASTVLGEAFKPEMSDRDIKVAVVKKVDGEDVAADAHDAYVQGRFDSARKRADKGADALASAQEVIAAGRVDAGSQDDEKAARERMKAASRDAYKAKEGK